MRRTLNLKFLAYLLIGLVLTSGSVALAHHFQYRRIPSALLRQAEKAETQGELARAEDYLTRYLDFEPDDLEQKTRLGHLLTHAKKKTPTRAEINKAYFVIQDVLARDPEQQELRRKFIPLAIQMDRLESAAEQLRLLPHDAETAGLWGRWYEAKDDPVQALNSYREAFKLNPASADVANRFVKLLRSQTWEKLPRDQRASKREAARREADNVVDTLVKSSPDSWQAHITRWNDIRENWLAERRGEKRHELWDMLRTCLIEQAAKDVARALELREGEADVRLAAAELAQMQDRLEDARSHLDKAMQLHRKEPRVYKAYAGLELSAEQKEKSADKKKELREQALGWLKQGAQELKPPAQFDLLWAHAMLLLDTGTTKELDEAAGVINRIRVQNISPAGADFLQARLNMGRQQWAEAARLFERSRPAYAPVADMASQIDLHLGRCYDELNEPQRQYDTYKRLLQRTPNSMTARIGLAQAARSLGRVEEALRYYDEISQSPSAPRVIWSEQVRLGIIKASQSKRNDDWQKVEDAINEAKKKGHADSAEVAVMRAELLLARSQPDQAKEVLDKAREENPQRAELWAAQATLAQRMKDPDRAILLLNEAEKTLKNDFDKAELRVARANYWVDRRNDQTKAELKKLSDDETIDKFPSRERNRVLHGLAEANYRAGSYEEAGRLWKKLAKQEEYRADLRLRLMLFDLALQNGNEEEMTVFLDEIKALEGGDGTFARHAEALRLVWLVKKDKVTKTQRKETLEQALRLLDQVAAARPTWSASLLARAEIEMLRGQPDQAANAYAQAIKLGDRSPLVLRQYIETLRKQGRIEEADRALKGLSKDELRRAELDRAAAGISLLMQHTDKGIEQALGAIQNDSRDYRDHLWLGQIIAASRQKPDLAEEHLRKAVELEGSEPETWVTLVRFLVTQKQEAEAERLLAVAKTSIKPARVSLAAAQMYGALKKPEEALKHYQEALKAKADDAATLADFAAFRLVRGEYKEAETLLRAMLDENVEKTAEETEWAHARFALLLSADADLDRLKEALKHVGLKLTDDYEVEKDDTLVRGESMTLARIGARVLATNPMAKCRDEAIKRFEELDQRQALSTEDRFVLSRLYEARGDWPKARQQLSLASLARDRTPQYVIAYAQGLLENRELAEASRVLTRLEEMHKANPWNSSEFSLFDLRVRWHEARKEGDKAVTLLRERLAKKESDPQEVLLLVASLGRQKRYAEALNELEEVWKKCPSEMAGGTSVALLRSVKATDTQMKAVANHLAEAVKKDPKNVNLLVQLGDVLDLSGSYQEAEGKYREALKIEPKNAMALNNLSWLLAQRTKQGDEALTLINRAIEAVGPRGEFLDTRGVIYLTLGKTNEAEADLQAAMKESPTPARAFHLARVYAEAKNVTAAKKALVRANELGLQPAQLHPVEQVAHRKISEDLLK